MDAAGEARRIATAERKWYRGGVMMMSAIKKEGGERWCILRTSPARTLKLAQSLSDAGFGTWTPMATVLKRKPRRPGAVKVEAALMPTFVFAPAEHLAALHADSRSPTSLHPAFSIFRFDGRVPLLSDREMERLRAAERRAVPKRQRRSLPVGASVRPSEGPYAGMSGIVKRSDGRFTLVAFGGWMEVQIETFAIAPNEIRIGERNGIAA